MKSSQQLVIVLLLLGIAIIAPAVVNYIVDPYQIFRPKSDGTSELRSNTRFQVAGLIRTYLANPEFGFDTVIIGDSHGLNFAQSRVQEALGTGGVLKFCMSGSKGKTHRIVAERALEEPTLHRVIWELGNHYSNPDPNVVSQWHTFPSYLYGDWPGLARYLFNVDIFQESLKSMRSNADKYGPQGDDWASWFTNERKWGELRDDFHATLPELNSVISELQPTRPNDVETLRTYQSTDGYPIIDLVAEIVRANPDVEFDFFVPPNSILRYATLTNEQYARMFFMRRYAVDVLGSLPNAHLYAFDDTPEVVCNLDFYKDQGHYHRDINDWIIDSIALGNHELTSENIEKYERTWLEMIRDYTIPDDKLGK